jgi:hypothetical protein
MTKKPENNCQGCKGRDEINKSLAERVDELERENEELKREKEASA